MLDMPGNTICGSLARGYRVATGCVLAVVLLAQSAVGVAAQGTQPPDDNPTGASYFRGTMQLGGDILDEGEETTVGDMVQARGFTEVGLVIDVSDPRLSGSLARVIKSIST
jgi:hypothetical protein